MATESPLRSIFRRYDIRGIVGTTLTEDIAARIGRAFAELLRARGARELVLARDARLSSPALARAFGQAVRDGGIDLVDLGLVPTPLAYYATCALDVPHAAIVTGSHNPAEYNGLKLVVDGLPLHGDALQDLYRRVCAARDWQGRRGGYRPLDLRDRYVAEVTGRLRLARPLRVAVDCGNGVAGVLAPRLLRALGCEVTVLFGEPDGRFPNHHPNPSEPANLEALQALLGSGRFDLGLAFDGDADRLGVLDERGRVQWPDRQMMLFADELLRRKPGATVLYDVKSSWHLGRMVEALGGTARLVPSGHSLIRQAMAESGAELGGELAGHLYFRDGWYGFDDALYTAARLLALLSRQPAPASAVFGRLPDTVSTPELLLPFESDYRLRQVMRALARRREAFDGLRIVTLDGLRVEYPDGWGLVRASNTTPSLSLRFEAENPAALAQIRDRFDRVLRQVVPDLHLPA